MNIIEPQAGCSDWALMSIGYNCKDYHEFTSVIFDKDGTKVTVVFYCRFISSDGYWYGVEPSISVKYEYDEQRKCFGIMNEGIANNLVFKIGSSAPDSDLVSIADNKVSTTHVNIDSKLHKVRLIKSLLSGHDVVFRLCYQDGSVWQENTIKANGFKAQWIRLLEVADSIEKKAINPRNWKHNNWPDADGNMKGLSLPRLMASLGRTFGLVK
jgi:hypothetical protein